MMRWIALVMAMAAMTACSTQSGRQVTYYRLAPDQAPAGPLAEKTAAATLVVSSVTLPMYLNGKSLVVEQSPVKVAMARWHQWVESPDRMLTRRLIDDLERQLAGVKVVSARKAAALSRVDTGALFHLDVALDRFNATTDGHAQISGRWWLTGPSRALAADGRIEARQPLGDDGYDALAEALGRSWSAVAQSIGDRLAPLLPKQP